MYGTASGEELEWGQSKNCPHFYYRRELKLGRKIESWTYFGHTYQMLQKYYENDEPKNPTNPYKPKEKHPVGELPGVSRGV